MSTSEPRQCEVTFQTVGNPLFGESVLMIEKAAYDALAKENERLKAEDKHNEARIHRQSQIMFDLEQERDQLRSEVERLKAELETVKGERNELAEALKDNAGEAINACVAENDRLRTALAKAREGLEASCYCEADWYNGNQPCICCAKLAELDKLEGAQQESKRDDNSNVYWNEGEERIQIIIGSKRLFIGPGQGIDLSITPLKRRPESR